MVAATENLVGYFSARGDIAYNDLLAFCNHHTT
jgi:hypothetical protein